MKLNIPISPDAVERWYQSRIVRKEPAPRRIIKLRAFTDDEINAIFSRARKKCRG
jgi:hypothetical protein